MTTPAPFLTEEMRQQAIGAESPPIYLEVEKGAIIRFAEAIGDDNHLFSDEEAARQSQYGGLIAPPTFLRSAKAGRPELPFKVPFQRALDGGSDWEYFEPVRP
ncbi:MAG: MaoC family dehydratase N-terminal domain-containing protein, partial [Dehalococcoidia bacterium]|nr:MaoC family dehydratase N-terminal domain-containing protein [Dehalococcoidia bacterium]